MMLMNAMASFYLGPKGSGTVTLEVKEGEIMKVLVNGQEFREAAPPKAVRLKEPRTYEPLGSD